MKKGKKSLSEKLIYNNKFVMFVSVSLAIIIWVSVKINYSTEITRVVSDVRINLNTSMFSETGYKYFVDEEQLYVDVEISGKAYNINPNVISKDNIIVTASEVYVDSPGHKLISLNARIDGGNGTAQVVSVNPSSIAVYYDREVTDVFNVEAQITNNPDTLVNEDYIFSGLIPSKSTVEITGPETVLAQLEKVYFSATADKSELPFKENTALDAVLKYEFNGNADAYYLSCPAFSKENPKVTVVVKAQKTIPTAIKYVNQPSAYTASDDNIRIDPETVRILGSTGSKENRYLVETVDFRTLSNKKNVFEYTCDETQSADKLIDNIETFTVTIDFSDLSSKKFDPEGCTVVYVGRDDSYEYKLDFSGFENESITVIGPYDSLAALTAESIQIEINADVLTRAIDNSQTVEISNISIQSEQKNDCWIYGTYNATLTATPIAALTE